MTKQRPSVLITGASRGLGRALLDCYCSRGWHTVPLVRNAEIAQHLESEMTDCTPVVGDVTQDNVGAAITEALRDVGHLDVLINNAGRPGRAAQIDSVAPSEVDSLLQTHCLGALRCTKAALPFMKDGRRIVINLTSRFGSTTRQASGEYADRSISYSYRMAKAGLNMLTVCLAQELGIQGFVVCAVHPGRLRTESGASDADTEPEEAARRLADWIDGVDADMNSKCFDLEKQTMMEW